MNRHYKYPLFYLTLSLLIWLNVLSTGCGKSSINPVSEPSKCGIILDNYLEYISSTNHYTPDSNWLVENIRIFRYTISTTNICPYITVFPEFNVVVDSSAFNEGLTASCKVDWSNHEQNIKFITGPHQHGIFFYGFDDVDLSTFIPDSAYCNVTVLIKFPTKGNEQLDLNYLFSKTIKAWIRLIYHEYLPSE